MITFEMYGEKLKIRNDDWKKLRKRLNPDNAVLDNELGRYCINVSCSLCDRYQDNYCIKCPFNAFEPAPGAALLYGCSVFFGRLFREQRFSVGTSFVSWKIWVDKKARKQLKRLNEIMGEIEEANK